MRANVGGLRLSVPSLGEPVLPEIDLGFALAASSMDADRAFSLMKNVIRAIVDKYGRSRLRYMTILLGDKAMISFSFADTFSSDESLKGFISSLSRLQGQPDLEKALKEAREAFYRNARPKAKKIMVLLTDKDNTGDKEKTKFAAKGLDIDGIKVRVCVTSQGNIDFLMYIRACFRFLRGYTNRLLGII